MNATISITEIEKIFNLIIAKFKKDNINRFEFDDDNYWIILSEEWTNFDTSPKPAVGSLVDDSEFLKSVIQNDEIITFLELERLAALLRAISNQLVK